MNALKALLAVQEFAASPQGREATSSGLLDWLLLGISIVAVVASYLLCVRYLLRPGESDPRHIKREVLRDTPSR